MNEGFKSENDERRDEYPRLLEIEYRNPVQAEVIQMMLGEKAHNVAAVVAWTNKYLHRISDILDHPEQEELRATAREGRYKEAAKIIVDFLEKK